MKDKAFVDTNVLIYLYSQDEPEKKQVSHDIFNKFYCIISDQVINELSNVLIRKFQIKPLEVIKVIDEIIANCEISLLYVDIIKKALNIVDKYGYSYFDSLIIAIAIESECKLLLTEDMQDGQNIEKQLIITNIFKDI